MAEALEPRDSELLRWLAAGDENSFVLLYRRHQGALYRFALHMTGSPEIAADVVQDTFLAVIRGTAKFDPERGSPSGFLFGIARNQVHRVFEKESRFVPLIESEFETHERNSNGTSNGNGNGIGNRLAYVNGEVCDGSDGITQEELVKRLRAAISHLPAHYREVVTLCDLEGKSYEQAATLLSCPIGTVRSRLNRARDLLAEKMKLINAQQSFSGTKVVRTTGR